MEPTTNEPAATAQDAPQVPPTSEPVPAPAGEPSAQPEQPPQQKKEAGAVLPSKAAAVDALASVLAMIDGSGPDAAHRVSLPELQRACVKVPQLSCHLTGDRRYKLYVQLLLEEDGSLEEVPVGSFATTEAEKATEAHKAVAARIAPLFPAGHFASLAEVEGFIYHFASRTGFYFSEEQSNVLVAVAGVVAEGKLATGAENLHMLYNLMAVIAKDFLVSNSSRLYDGATVLLLRLLLQYQDPVLSAHLDQYKVNAGTLLLELVRGLFIRNGDAASALGVLDWIFVLGDPVLVPYVALAALITVRQGLVSIDDTAALGAALQALSLSLPGDRQQAIDPQLVDGRSVALVPVWSGKSLCQNADLLFRSTPLSAQRVLEHCLCPESGTINKTPQALEAYYAAAPCLPLERSDVAAAFTAVPNPVAPQRQYVIVDCRSQGSFNYARLPTAVLVGDVLSYDEGKLGEVVERLRSAKGTHLSLFGTGRALEEEVNLLTVVALHLVRHGVPFISITTGGFKGIIPLIRSNAIRVVLNNGEPLPDAEEHSLLAGLPERLTGLRDAILPTDTEAVKVRATELREKAKDSLSSAGSWGWDLVQKAQERLTTVKDAASAALVRASAPATTTTTAAVAGTAATVAAGGAAAAGTQPPQGAPLQGRVAPPHQTQVFTLGDEDEGEDDFDLITTVPPKPLKGTLVGGDHHSASAPASGSAPAGGAGASPKAAAPATQTQSTLRHENVEASSSASAAQIAATIDKEFEDLFGN